MTAAAQRFLGSLFARDRATLRSRLRERARQWSRRRHGRDSDPAQIAGKRIYILPTRLGVTFATMVFAMFIGAMNYGNNLALGLAFLLGGVALTAMHYAHRNLAGLIVRRAGCEPVFAGQTARFRFALENPAKLPRYELTLANETGEAEPQRIDAGARVILEVRVAAERRGRLTLDHARLISRHPFGLFRAWTYVHLEQRCIVYPRPAERGIPPTAFETDTGGAQDLSRGDEDFAGLRSFHPGDSPRHIAWKVFAREQGLQVKVYAGTQVVSHLFDWDALAGLDSETRLSLLCRWIEDAHAQGRAFGLTMPGVRIPPNVGAAHRQRCLTALALFEA